MEMKKTFFIVLTALMAVLLVVSCSQDVSIDSQLHDNIGTGSAEVSVKIGENTVTMTLAEFAAEVNAGTEGYESAEVTLLKDVDISSSAWIPIGKGYRTGNTTVGKKFSGTFDGNGHTIRGLNNSGIDYEGLKNPDNEYTFGLFGCVEGATIKDLTLSAVAIEGSDSLIGDNVGALIGYSRGSLTVSGITVSGSVAGHSVAGIVGRAYGSDDTEASAISITGCVNNATVAGSGPHGSNTYISRAAGIIAYVRNHKTGDTVVINSCTNNGVISVTGLTTDGDTIILAGVAVTGFNNTVDDDITLTGNTNNGALTATEGTRNWVGQVASSCNHAVEYSDTYDFRGNSATSASVVTISGTGYTNVPLIAVPQQDINNPTADYTEMNGSSNPAP